jgi:hypothetical protein
VLGYGAFHCNGVCSIGAISATLLVLPYFFDKKLRTYMPDVHLTDYVCTYENHTQYARRERSCIHLFTDMPGGQVVLPSKYDYK